MDRKIVFSGYFAPDPKKNDYYRIGFHIMMRIVNIQAVIIFVLSIALTVYLATRQNQDRYFAETGDSKIMRLVALPLPNMGRVALSDWVAKSVSEIMTFGFNDVNERFAQSRHDFTSDGWITFSKAVTSSTLIDDMMQLQQIVTSVPESPPILKQEGLINGRYSWVFDIPLLVTFRAGGAKQSRSKMVHITVERVPTSESPSGVGISQWKIS